MSPIVYQKDKSIAILKLNRPDKFNSFTREMALLMQEKLKEAQEDSEVRAILITGEGKAFCAGQDLAEAIDPNGPGITRIVEEHYNPIVLKIREIEKPVICAVNGVAAGAGANIAFACDIVLSADSASFIQAFSKIGLIPDSGGTFFLPRLIGLNRASALMMTGDKVTAAEAKEMGLVYKTFADDKLMEEALALSHHISMMPTKGIGLTKRLLNESFTNSLSQQLKREAEIQTEAGNTQDNKEGVQAFLEKRKPVFKGC